MTSIAARLAASGLLGITLFVAGPPHASAEPELDTAAEMARALRDPLAKISALMTDNDILFDTGDGENTSYQFQLQPVYAFDFPEQGLTLIPRAVIPIIGAARGADLPPIGTPGDLTERTWGLGDIVTQFFLAPKVDVAGHGVDINMGAYGNAVRPDNGPKWSLEFGVSWLIPR